ncbi:MAG: class I SAM-dependent methyltransferase [Bryobacteraceae bacterium]
MSSDAGVNLWRSPEHALEYLRRAETIPHRAEGEAMLLGLLPERLERFLDLGSGNGRLLALVKSKYPKAQAVAVDFSPTMLAALLDRFAPDASVEILEHDLDRPLPPLGEFDAVVSSFAIHHLPDARKRSLYEEAYRLLRPGGMFCNLEHVSSPTEVLHQYFLAQVDKTGPVRDDPSNKLLDTWTQVRWLAEIGFDDADCYWKWLELALLAGRKPLT